MALAMPKRGYERLPLGTEGRFCENSPPSAALQAAEKPETVLHHSGFVDI